MAFVDYAAGKVRDFTTSLTKVLAIGTSTSESIAITSTTINAVITTLPLSSISYPGAKNFTLEFLLPSTEGNGYTLRRIATKESESTTNVITMSNVPALDKNSLIEVSYEITIGVDNS